MMEKRVKSPTTNVGNAYNHRSKWYTPITNPDMYILDCRAGKRMYLKDLDLETLQCAYDSISNYNGDIEYPSNVSQESCLEALSKEISDRLLAPYMCMKHEELEKIFHYRKMIKC